MALSCRFLSALIVFAVGFTRCLADTDVSLAALVGRIEALEEQGKIQQTIILEQNEKLVQQEKKIKELMDWKERQFDSSSDNPSNIMEVNQAEIQPDELGLRDRSEKPNIRSDDLQTKDNSEDADKYIQSQGNDGGITRGIKIANVDSKTFRKTETSRALLEPDGPVAFHAVMNGSDVSIGPNQHLIFNLVFTNLGGGYHNLHGLFITPSSGVYIFSTSVYSHGDESVDVSILKNGMRLASASAISRSAAGNWDQGSVTIVTQLKAGDEVWVQHHVYAGTQIVVGDLYTSFMGCRVVPM